MYRLTTAFLLVAIVMMVGCKVASTPRSGHRDGKSKAWVNTMPPKPDHLIVTGEVMAPTPSHTVKLVKENLRDPHIPEMLYLEAVATSTTSSGMVCTQKITPTAVRYEMVPYRGGYRQVAVKKLNGIRVLIDIETAR